MATPEQQNGSAPEQDVDRKGRASIQLNVKGRMIEVVERRPGQLTGDDGKISADTARAIREFLNR